MESLLFILNIWLMVILLIGINKWDSNEKKNNLGLFGFKETRATEKTKAQRP